MSAPPVLMVPVVKFPPPPPPYNQNQPAAMPQSVQMYAPSMQHVQPVDNMPAVLSPPPSHSVGATVSPLHAPGGSDQLADQDPQTKDSISTPEVEDTDSCWYRSKSFVGGISESVARCNDDSTCKIATVVVGAIIGITLLVLAIISYIALAIAAADMQNLVNNWSRLPYTDIATVVDTANCPTGFSEIPRPVFPGTSRVCDCPSGNAPLTGFKTPGVYEQACNSSQTWCTQYNALSSQTLQWRGVKFCVKTFSDPSMSAFVRPRASATKACPAGYFPCNANSSSTTDIFCSSVQGVCPLTSLAIVTSLAQAPAGANCTQFAGGASFYVCKSTGQSPWPVVFSNFQDAGVACMPGADFATTRSTTDVRSGDLPQCVQTDTRWTVQDSQAPRNVYAASASNGLAIPNQPSSTSCSYGTCTGKWYARFTQAPVSGDNFYYSPSDFPDIIYASQPEVPWSQACKVERSRIAALVDGVQTVRKGTLAILIIAAFTLVIVDVVLAVRELLSRDFDDGEREQWFLKNFFTFGAALAKLIAIAIQYEAAIMLGDITTVADNPCSDAVTQTSFATLSTTIVRIVGQSKVMIAFAIITMLMTLKDCAVHYRK